MSPTGAIEIGGESARRLADLDRNARPPEIAAGVAIVAPDGSVLDDVAVIWQSDRLDFELRPDQDQF